MFGKWHIFLKIICSFLPPVLYLIESVSQGLPFVRKGSNDNITDGVVNISELENIHEIVEKMEDTEVNYENVRNIPIQLFDGRIVEKKKIEVETKHVYSTIIRKEKKELLDEEHNDVGESEDAKANEDQDSECKKIPIKINYFDSISTSPRIRRTQTSTQNRSLSSSVPSLAEVSRKTREPKKNCVDTSTPRRQQTLNEIQNDLEVEDNLAVYCFST